MTNTVPVAQVSQAVPHKKGWPGLGVLPALLGPNPFAFLRDVMLEHGDLVRVDFGPQAIYLVSHPDYVLHIMRDKSSNYRKPEAVIKPFQEMMGGGLLTSSGDVWLRQRRMIQPHLHRKQLAVLFNEMVSAITEALDAWTAHARAGTELNLRQETANITMNVIMRTMFGSGLLSPAEAAVIAPAVTRLIDYAGRGLYTNALPKWLIPGRKQFETDLRELGQIIQRVIKQVQQTPTQAASLLQILLNAVDDTNAHMTAQQVFDEVVTVFVAGYETTATALVWLGVVLDQHPEVAAKLQAEVRQVLGTRLPTFEDMARLTYTRQVFMEILRMYSIAPMTLRASNAADHIGPYAVPAEAQFFVFFYGVHHNPRLWENPEVFDPERFSPERQAAQPTFAFMPFNVGPRKCAGEDFALLEGPLVMAMILQRYMLNILPNQNYETRLAGTHYPRHGVKFTLKPAPEFAAK